LKLSYYFSKENSYIVTSTILHDFEKVSHHVSVD